jgi:uncharacterized protein involved in outer membrane biogenesis
MKAFKIIASVFVALIVIILLVVSFGLGGIIKKAVTTMGPKALGAPVELKSVRVSPFSGLVQIKGLKIGNPEGFHTDAAMELAELKVKVKLSSLLTDKVVVSEILIDAPQITYEKSLKSSNLAALQKNVEAFAGPKVESPEKEPAAPEQEAAAKKPAKKVQIDKLVVSNGAVKLSITALKGNQMTVPLPNIEKEGIGADKEGASFADAAKEVWSSIMDGVTGVVGSAGGVLKDVGTGTVDAVKEGAAGLIKGVGGMFKSEE